MIPSPPVDDNWERWANRHYPHNEVLEKRMRIGTYARGIYGTEQQLEEIAVVDRAKLPGVAGALARLWFSGIENADKIEESQREQRIAERERMRLERAKLARIALRGELGRTKKQQESAAEVAKTFLPLGDPGSANFEQLYDWYAMHLHSLSLQRGLKPERPKLYADRRKEVKMRRDVREIDDAIGAVSGELFGGNYGK